jgi:hypothetical protein
VLELDLLDEVDLAVLDDLAVVLGRLVDEERHELLLLFGRQLAEREHVVAAAASVDTLENLRQLAPERGGVGDDADGVLEVDRADLLEVAPHRDPARGRLRRHAVREHEEAGACYVGHSETVVTSTL